MRLAILCLLLTVVVSSQSEDLHTTKVFIMTIGPWFFNWTDSKSSYVGNQYSYRPSLLGSPDLPSWMFYTSSERHNQGFIYGAPPPQQKDLQIEVVGLNRINYEARRRVIKMNVLQKNEPALHEVRLKVDKLNVEDMLEFGRYNSLLDIFRRTLWPESQNDLYVTFLASAVHLGARLPLNPTEGEGIVVHVGSRSPFSQTLLDLQQEVSPLQSKGQTNCPDFKHTSVERFFKQYNFSLDWCAFTLSVEPSRRDDNDDRDLDTQQQSHRWLPVNQQELPTRNYHSELAVTLIVPLLCYIIMVALLTFILCFQRDTMSSVEKGGLRPNPPPYAGIHHSDNEEYLDDDDARTWYC